MLAGVSKTAIVTLRARADEHARSDRAYADPMAVEWYRKVHWPSELDAWYLDRAQTPLALRAHDFDVILSRFASKRPGLTVVELGCGLSTRAHRLRDLGVKRWIDLDLPSVIELRRRWGATDEDQLAYSVLDPAWMDFVPAEEAERLIFVAEGLLYYLPRSEVDGLIATLADRFRGAALLLDALGAMDYERLQQHTADLDTPIQWAVPAPLEDALHDLGLQPVDGFSPERLHDDMLQRYWHRFDAKLRGLIYAGRAIPAIWGQRSGNVLGTLGAV